MIRTYIELIIFIALIVISFIIKRKYDRLEKELLIYIKKHFPNEHRGLSIELSRYDDSSTILGSRILKRSKKLPSNPFLEKQYVKSRKLFFAYAAIMVILGIYFIITLLRN